ncbi:MAG TPA: multidrug efflux RND transporter permease subunit [Pirellulales bacterium]|jgi:HAE1 family hydrophobic/amphiphilic exporter-1|nr:multidrug efflux RND transporter permease subunit [Pirellulales bacterium]
MFSRFFIEHPVFANVIAVLTLVFGGVTVFELPIEQYPDITPPTVQVTTTYPGASAQVVADTIASPIEEQVNGVEHMLYMSSTSASDGSYTLIVTFDVGTDPNMDQVLVQNRVQTALPLLPPEVQLEGVVTQKQSTDIVMFVTLTSPNKEYDSLFLSNYATINVQDPLTRLPGVGQTKVVGAGQYSLRMWLDADKLTARNITTQDVVTAVQQQNVQVAAGIIGEPPTKAKPGFQYTVSTLGRLVTPEQFGDIIIKVAPGPSAQITRVKDVARVELGAQTYSEYFQVNGKPAAGIAIFQLPGANALDVAKRVKAEMEKLKGRFPKGLVYDIPFNTTLFVSAAIDEVYWTLAEAGVLVLFVILMFLQDWRAILVPATTVPVTIIGAFAAMYALGFTINLLTMFGLILAIGIVVDDAIVIVENASHHIEEGMDPKPATIKAMNELLGPIIGITLVLAAVFLPASFLGGITGQLYRQFALTIAATAVISATNALTLKPAQCATYLRKPSGRKKLFIFRWFNKVYGRVEKSYERAVGWVVRHASIMMLGYAVLLGLAAWGFFALPTGFLPTEDQGYFVISAQLPDAASLNRTEEVVEKLNEVVGSTPGVQNVNAINGQNVVDGTVSSNAAACYVTFKDWSQRKTAAESQAGVLAHLAKEFAKIPNARILAFPPPAIRGLGVSGGFQMEVQDTGNLGLNELGGITNSIVAAGNGQSNLRALNTTFSANVPQLYLDIDRSKAQSLNVPLNLVFDTLQTYLGSTYVNNFNEFGRTFQVTIQADANFRDKTSDITRLEVRNNTGGMVPLGTLLKVQRTLGPTTVLRYQLYPAATITGQTAPNISSGQGLDLMEQIAQEKLPPGASYEWTAMAYQEKLVRNQAIYVFGLAVLLVYLVLAAQYESWIRPMAVILVVPLALLGTVTAVALRGMDNNIYTQIGIVLIIALASKNAILIVEFAKDLRAAGHGILQAATEAAQKRFRPIIMTSLAFILGVFPLVIAQGAGAASRQSLGTAVFGGMIAATFLTIFFVPVFFILCQSISEWWSGAPEIATKPPEDEGERERGRPNG